MTKFEFFLKNVGEIGHVKSIRGALAYCTGLHESKVGERIIFEGEQLGIVSAFTKDLTEVLILDPRGLGLGAMAVRTREIFGFVVSSDFLGKVLDPLGVPVNGKKINTDDGEERFMESSAPPLIDRVRISENLETGNTLVDVLIPIGKGQRQLIIGDQKTGKTSFLLDTIARQAELGTVCVYTAIGKKRSDIVLAIDKLTRLGAMKNTVIIAAPTSIPSSLIYLSMYTAFAAAEYFRDKGRDVLVVLDEVSSHAKYYRELSLLSRKMPGRDGYPGDIFHMHAHLLERAGRFRMEEKSSEKLISMDIGYKTSSITCLPVVGTTRNDFTGYVQTNLMSMTDGHLFFDASKFQQGLRPPINIGLSVTRLGKKSQTSLERDYAVRAKEIVFAYNRAQNVAKFGVELMAETRQEIAKGAKLYAIFEQPARTVVPRLIQLLFLDLLFSGFWDESEPVSIKHEKERILAAYKKGVLLGLVKDLEEAYEVSSPASFAKAVEKHVGELAQICSR